MSHFSTLRSKLTDIELLKTSLRDLGFTVETNAQVQGIGCQQVRAEVVAVLEDGYGLGWSKNADGSLDLIADLWAVAKTHNLPQLVSLINQKYAVNQTLAALQRPGLQTANVQVMLQQ